METQEQIERRLAEIDDRGTKAGDVGWLTSTVRSLLPALAVARAAVAIAARESDWQAKALAKPGNCPCVGTMYTLDKVLHDEYCAALARFADAEGGSK